MKKTDLGTVSPFHSGDKLLVAIADKYMKANNGKPLTFSAEITKKGELVLTAVLAGLVRANVSDPREESDGSS